jgi:hypothetical protein
MKMPGTNSPQLVSLVLAVSISSMLVVSSDASRAWARNGARAMSAAETTSLVSSMTARQSKISASTGGCSGVSFTQPAGSPVGAGNHPWSAAVADLNLDGRLDLAVVNTDSNNVTILLSNGGGGFTEPAGSPVGVPLSPCPSSVAAGDFNLDGKPDLAVVSNCFNNVTILLGNGSGGFTEAAGSPVTAGASAESVAVGDFNLDGKPDLVVTNFGSNNVTILLGNGSGGFTQAAGSPVSTGISPGLVAVGDFNLDGKSDLAVVNRTSDNVTILLGNGSGGFTQAAGSPIGVGSAPHSLAIGDFNLDGKPDLAVANANSDSVTILLGNGSGGFTQAAASTVGAGTTPLSVAVADFNLDGLPDLAVVNARPNGVTILLGDGGGGFIQASGSPVIVGIDPFAIAVGDFNLDGKPDFATANHDSNNITIQLNTCAPAPDFSLSFDHQIVTGEIGTKVSAKLNITRTTGLTGNVTISVPETLPLGIAVALEPTTPTTGNSLTFKIKLKRRAKAGTHTLVFTGVDDSGRVIHTVALTLVVQ